MLKKFISIRNIGSFSACAASGDVELRKFTLVLAENGRGKTTLCDILRSLKTGIPDVILGRRRLGVGEAPKVSILVDDRRIDFDEGAWTEPLPEIELFDSTFVSSNVFSGEVVQHEHKKNLYQVIVGERGVALAQEVTALDQQSREVSRLISEAENRLSALLPPGTPVDAFIGLPIDGEIDRKITEKAEELRRAERSAEVAAFSSYTTAPVPAAIENVVDALRALEGDAPPDSLEKIRVHLAEHTNGGTEGWLSTGTSVVKDVDCPYCGQSLEDLPLYDAYKAIFRESYRSQVSNLNALLAGVQTFGENWSEDRQILAQQHKVERGRFWEQFGVPAPEPPAISGLDEVLSAYRVSLQEVLKEKIGRPFDIVVFDEELTTLEAKIGAFREEISEYNHRVAAANREIDTVKEEVGRADSGSIQAQLQALNLVKLRGDPALLEGCQAVIDTRARKQGIEHEKGETKAVLDRYTDTGFPEFEEGMNRLLEAFGAGFRISDTKRSYVGGRPSSSFQIVINDVGVELGDGSTPLSQPSFRNTLSSGDRSTLALAFFLESLEHDDRLNEKVVVFDDPFGSQDRSRRTCTMQRILRLARRAEQVIVLSHEPLFLKRLWEGRADLAGKPLQLSRVGIWSTTITEWDIEESTRGDYQRDQTALQAFSNEGVGEPIDIVRKIRPVMEGYLRHHFPGCFRDDQWLGDFIEVIRTAETANPASALLPQLEEIEDINEYSKRYHHPQDQAGDVEPINDGELTNFVRRVLRLVGAI